MSTEAIRRFDFADLTRDPLVRLVMESDGVTEADLVALLTTAKRAVDARSVTGRPGDVPMHKRARRIRAVPAACCSDYPPWDAAPRRTIAWGTS
jgi:hypothetical protein